ncbi:MAG TPA: hypothetical protein VF148_00640 [Acidimicrobiia bacterium]
MSDQSLALATASLLCWVALVHVTLAAGVRRGELVWSGRQPRLLDPGLRLRSAVSAVLLVASAWVLAEATGALTTGLLPEQYMLSATFSVTAFLGIYFIYVVFKGSRWERWLFAPIILAGAGLAGWLTFT